MKKLLILALSLFSIILSYSQTTPKQQWVDSVYQSLNNSERFGQLLMIRANQESNKYIKSIDQYIKDYSIGGVCFFAGYPGEQLQQTEEWQRIAKIPLLIGIDGEWGLGMRLKETISYPFQMTLGSIYNDSLIYDMGYQIGLECKRMGIHMNFAPVVDINNNPNNPVINSRSFGDQPKNVATKASMYMSGLQDAGIIATAKHFPGHGDTGTDSHYTLPVVSHDKSRLDSVELFPFYELIENGLGGIMVAHLYVPVYEAEENVASTLSKNIITGLLRENMGFDGLIVTDALDMKGVTKYFPPGEIEVRALLAGNDILLLPENIPAAIDGLLEALSSGRISKSLLELSCKKILSYKYDAGLYEKPEFDFDHLIEDLNTPKGLALKEKLHEESITLITNHENILPLSCQKPVQLAIVSYGFEEGNTFENTAYRYSDASYFYPSKALTKTQNDSLFQILEKFETIIFNIGNTTIFPQRSFGITSAMMELIEKTNSEKTCIINLLGSPLAIKKFFINISDYEGFILGHQDNKMTRSLSAQMIFGALSFKGKLPVQINEKYPAGFGIQTAEKGIIKFGKAENQGINTIQLNKNIDSIVKAGINMKAFPGCQIVIAKNGYIIFQENYGFQTYDSLIAVNGETIYDIASITKVTSSIPSIMYLQDKKKVHPDTAISKYLTFLENTNKQNLTFRSILSHNAQLKSWIPFYWYNADSTGLLNHEVFQNEQSDEFKTRVAENLYITSEYAYEMYDTISNSDLRKRKGYKYSDLGYYWVPKIVEQNYNMPFENFVYEHFYKPLNLNHTRFHPRQYFDLEKIAPTENDTLFRKQIIRGDVHDPGAAMLGGVCGHAGLFSNAEDIAVIFQMYLQNGYYGGIQFFDTTTINEYTSYQHDGIENRRAMGFDKPFKKYDAYGPVCESASLSSFGHSGFTGTYVWADPEENLVYVFLSNRVYPRSDNYKISKFDIRTNIQQAIYDAIINRNFEK
ncbi:serine hydrolase [Lentimicrobium sp. L6]|uniref:glycoside hydrolase family 3 N-terminal domain-containing protein n=1 Tax=Lentimicrobium sp. L6 TaxID=2735916 RepID=UPI00155556C1|nr:glycoside hydrolase family 3 N-terminal domain-containing protein [Lentimicrobium sp. L6]NPD83783.1 serine hydrolase [Lentimicrobium sp. L6]